MGWCMTNSLKSKSWPGGGIDRRPWKRGAGRRRETICTARPRFRFLLKRPSNVHFLPFFRPNVVLWTRENQLLLSFSIHRLVSGYFLSPATGYVRHRLVESSVRPDFRDRLAWSGSECLFLGSLDVKVSRAISAWNGFKTTLCVEWSEPGALLAWARP